MGRTRARRAVLVADFVLYPHATLGLKAAERSVDEAMLAVGERLLAAAEAVKAYGLAAAHLGLVEPVAVISTATDAAIRDYRLLYNPQVVQMSEDLAIGMEGSVSFPGVEVPVKRATWVDIAYDNGGGERQVLRLEGFAARVAQHEIDQIDGVFFLSRVSRLKRDTAIRKFEKSQRR